MEGMGVYKTCKDCGQTFHIGQKEQDWLLERGWALFERCKSCRDRRRADRTQRAAGAINITINTGRTDGASYTTTEEYFAT